MTRPLLSLLSLLVASASSADVVFFEDFEDADVGYIASIPEYNLGYYKYFRRSNGTDLGSQHSITGKEGGWYFAAQDVDAGDAYSDTQTLTFAFSVAGYTNLRFAGLFAEDDHSSESWGAHGNSVIVSASLDGGAAQPVFAIAYDGSFISAPHVDSDFDGVGEGVEITSDFAEFTAPITGTGDLLELVVTLNLDNKGKDIAFDSLQVTGALSVVPEPTAALVGSLISGGLGLSLARRPRRGPIV